MLTFEPPYHKKVMNQNFFLVYLDQVKHENYEFEVEIKKIKNRIFKFSWFLLKITLKIKLSATI